MATEFVFVYGTLKDYNVSDTFAIKGKLYDTGGGRFPGVVLGGSDRVEGQVMEVTEKELKRLDRYEGTPHLYRREKVWVEEIVSKDEGVYEQLGQAWIYVWNGETSGCRELDKWPM